MIVDYFFFFQAEDGIRDVAVTGVRRVLFRSPGPRQHGRELRADLPPLGRGLADPRRRALLRGLRRRDAPRLLGGRDGRDLHGRGPGRPRAGAPFRAPDADGLPPGPSGLTRADGRDSADRLNGNPPSRLRRLETLLAQTYRMHMTFPWPLASLSHRYGSERKQARIFSDRRSSDQEGRHGSEGKGRPPSAYHCHLT